MHGCNRCGRRAAAAALEHDVHLAGRTSENGFDRAIGKISHPSVQPETAGSADGPATIPNALDPSFDPDPHAFIVALHQLTPQRTTSRSLTCSKVSV